MFERKNRNAKGCIDSGWMRRKDNVPRADPKVDRVIFSLRCLDSLWTAALEEKSGGRSSASAKRPLRLFYPRSTGHLPPCGDRVVYGGEHRESSDGQHSDVGKSSARDSSHLG